jgi:hypothetical protein
MTRWMFLLALAACVPLAAKAKKPPGQIADRQAFAAIQSYCVDSSALPEEESGEVRAFVEERASPANY